MRLRFAWLALLALSGCAGDVPAAEGIALRDPLGLIDDVYDSGNSLRLYVLPAESFTCAPSSGGRMAVPTSRASRATVNTMRKLSQPTDT